MLESSQAGLPPKAASKPCLTHQEPAVETQASADTEEETLRRRLEELTSNISGSGTSSEDETKPAGTFLGVSPKVSPPFRSRAKHRARGTTPGSQLPLQGRPLAAALEVELDKRTQVKRLETSHGDSTVLQQPGIYFMNDLPVPRCAQTQGTWRHREGALRALGTLLGLQKAQMRSYLRWRTEWP